MLLSAFYISTFSGTPPDDLVSSLERRDRLTFLLVQGRADDASVAEVHRAVGLLLEAQGVFHPVLVVSLGVVFPGVGSAGLFPIGGRNGGLGANHRVN